MISSLTSRFSKPVLVAAGVVAAIVFVIGAYAVYQAFQPDTYEVTAQFPATPGLYPDNGVDVLGVPEGTVASITPRADHVDVVLRLPVSVKLPADAQAVLMAPNPVSDRFVELTPPYTGGPVLAANATIPIARSIVPLELDQIYQSVDQLAQMLGPSGANKNGELSDVLHAFAQLAQGHGADVHNAITEIAAALPALTRNPTDLKNLVEGLDTLTSSLAAHNSTIDALYGDLTTATTQLADERTQIATAVANLNQGLAQVAQFLQANKASLGGAITNLSATVSAVMSEQKALITTFDTAPLGFQNFNRAIDPNTACIGNADGTGNPHNCSSIWGRINFTKDALSWIQLYCGQNSDRAVLNIFASNVGLAPSRAVDTACGAAFGALENRPVSPNAPSSPNLDISRYLP
jgi:virulence factor Mce-like protein